MSLKATVLYCRAEKFLDLSECVWTMDLLVCQVLDKVFLKLTYGVLNIKTCIIVVVVSFGFSSYVYITN